MNANGQFEEFHKDTFWKFNKLLNIHPELNLSIKKDKSSKNKINMMFILPENGSLQFRNLKYH